MNRLASALLAAAALLVAGGALLVYSGVYNVSARAGHLSPTAWLLHYAMRKSARTYALGIDVPPLDDERMVVRGATYYALGCAPCHSEPGGNYPPIVSQMTPHAPALANLIPTWKPAELFWVVDNGIKYTGMPAWATGNRPDEVWSMVAFLQRLPELDVEAYRKLAYGPGTSGDRAPALTRLGLDERVSSTLEQCARCHGLDGMGRGTGAFPYLAGQNEEYLFESLRHYAAGARHSGIMQPVASGLLEATMRGVASHYAAAVPAAAPAPQARLPAAAVARGERIAQEGIPDENVVACAHCHGPDPVAANPAFPLLAGQDRDYLLQQLELWVAGKRGGTAYAALMREVSGNLAASEMADVAAYYASLPYFGGAPRGGGQEVEEARRGPAESVR